MSVACCVWDFTWNFSGDERELNDFDFWLKLDKDKIDLFLQEHCKKWAFQLERGKKTGRYHFQGRFSLKEKTRLSGLVKLLPGAHFSKTSNENRTNTFYVEKTDTRVDGPWKDTDKKKPLQNNFQGFWKRIYDHGRSLVCGLPNDSMNEELI